MTGKSPRFDVFYVTLQLDYPCFALSYRTLIKRLPGRGEIYVIVPDHEADFYRALDLRATIVTEREVDPIFSGIQARWYKQQMLKLCAHRVASTDAVLIMDSDVLLTRRIEGDELFVGGRSKLYIEDRQGRVHPDWIAQAESFLQLTPRTRYAYFPTPGFMDRRVLAAFHRYVARLYGGDSLQAMADRIGSFTEWASYGLFYTEVARAGEADADVHALCDDAPVHGIWDQDDFDAWEPARGEPPERPFLVLQSSLAASFNERCRKLEQIPDLDPLRDEAWPGGAYVVRANAQVILEPDAAGVPPRPMRLPREVIFLATALVGRLGDDHRFRICGPLREAFLRHGHLIVGASDITRI